ncbi:uncharacterized protein LOC105902103 [Clupea harengus]|uniref:Uncharacterized protein LOC105902103 n=1 Tax=Clupea harengus TaxID=7950 RepID=A0A6P8GIA7_CLUHA|nr:uncharacterized protein LOC105902103 [Clupea harengus]
MTHARQKGSLSRCHSVGRDQGGTRGRPRGETMGRAWPERFLKEAGAKRGMAKKGQSKEPKEVKGEVDRKHYPLRGRGGTLEEGLLSNPVQKLSRGQASGRRKKAQSGRARRGTSSRRARRGKSSTKSSDSEPSGSTSKASKTTSAAQDQGAGQVSFKTTSGQVSSKTTSGQVSSKTTSGQVSSKTTSGQVSSKTTSGQVSSKTTSGQVSSKTTSGQVSSKTTSGQVSSKTTSGQVSSKTTSGQVSSKTTSGQVSSKTTSAALLPPPKSPKRARRKDLLEGNVPPPQRHLLEGNVPPPQRHLPEGNATPLQRHLLEGNATPLQHQLLRTPPLESLRRAKAPKQQQQQQQQQKKPKATEKDVVDLSLWAPTPRRLAGLNAAALLRLTSSSATSKQRVKTDGSCATSKHRVQTDSSSATSKQRVKTDSSCATSKQRVKTDSSCATSKQRVQTDSSSATSKQRVQTDSSCATSKQRVKTDSSCATSKTDSRSSGASAGRKVANTKTDAPAAKKQLEPAGWKASSAVSPGSALSPGSGSPAVSPGSGYLSCKKGGFESSPNWGGAVEDPHLNKPGYQSGRVPEYPLKQVKEEQVEAELSPYCCCGPPGTALDYCCHRPPGTGTPPGTAMDYCCHRPPGTGTPPGTALDYCCHRLGLFLRQQPAAYPDAEEGPFAPVKQECLVPAPPPPSLAHPSLALSAHHPCLCADHCFPSYYVHMAHPRAPQLAALGSRPLPYGPPAHCSGPVSGSKLLVPGIGHSSGIHHPPFCTSVRSPCYSEACRVSPYTYRALQPVATRGCSFSTGCSRCRQEIKTEGYSTPRREHSPSLLQAPPAVPHSGCPLPRVTTPTSMVPHPLSPLSERRLGEAGVGLGRACPQGGTPSNGSLPARRPRLALKQQAPERKKVIRRRATNGWRPLGVPVEKEVFVVGEDEPVLRQCFEGVQREGEEIRVRDTVLLRSGPRKKSLPYVAKISALWEDPKTGELMMSLFWYYRPEHTQGGRDPSMHCENEIFASKHQDVNSVACIEDKCYVLPLAQYCRYCALVKRGTEGVPVGLPLVPCPADTAPPPHRRVPPDVEPELVHLCRHVYDFRYGRILKNLQ